MDMVTTTPGVVIGKELSGDWLECTVNGDEIAVLGGVTHFVQTVWVLVIKTVEIVGNTSTDV